MTIKDVKILAFVLLLFGWAFALAGAEGIAMAFFAFAFPLWVAWIVHYFKNSGGGPLRPA